MRVLPSRFSPDQAEAGNSLLGVAVRLAIVVAIVSVLALLGSHQTR
jgi:hypothetical protein